MTAMNFNKDSTNILRFDNINTSFDVDKILDGRGSFTFENPNLDDGNFDLN